MGRKKALLLGWGVVLASALWMVQGCTTNLPPMGAVAPTATPSLPDSVVSDFENGKVEVNPTLRGVLNPVWNVATPSTGQEGTEGTATLGNGSWRASTFGGDPPNTLNGGLSVDSCNVATNPCFILPIPASPPSLAVNNSRLAAHLFGDLFITTRYESHQLICMMRNSSQNPYFDASSFSGIQFDIYISSADNNTVPVFQIGTDKTTPPSSGVGGLCVGPSSSCYNHYTYNLSNLGTDPMDDPFGERAPLAGPDCSAPCRDTWVRLTLPWIRLNTTFGPYVGPLSASLRKIVLLQFQVNNNLPNPSNNYTDFWVDNVQFY